MLLLLTQKCRLLLWDCGPTNGTGHLLILCQGAQDALRRKNEAEGESDGGGQHPEGHETFADQPAAETVERQQGKMDGAPVESFQISLRAAEANATLERLRDMLSKTFPFE